MVLEVGTLSGAGVSVLVCTRGAAFEMNWWCFGTTYKIDFSPRLCALHVLTL